MRKFTAVDLATILQFSSLEIDKLKRDFDGYSENKRNDILAILWDGVHTLNKRLAQIKYQQFLYEVKEGKKELTTDLYDQAVKAVWQDFEDILTGKKKDVDQIEQIRASLQHPSIPGSS